MNGVTWLGSASPDRRHSTAAECLRSGLAEPSQVTPFIEPSLPYYDSVRDDPRFSEFLAEVETR